MSTTARPRPTDEEFAELARKRDEAGAEAVRAACERMGWEPAKVAFHASHAGKCYCACPEGPCQHIWDGPEWADDNSSSATCSRCGEVAMFHDLRCAP